jgi:hypothetical protein
MSKIKQKEPEKKGEYAKQLQKNIIVYLRNDTDHIIVLDNTSDEIHSILLNLYNGSITLPDANWFSKHQKTDLSFQNKMNLSHYKDWIPLYDVYSNEIYLIHRDNIFRRVHYDHYRLPDKNLLDKLIGDKVNIERMKKFMSNYDLDELQKTYEHVIYTYSPEVGKELIVCMRPSFTHCLRHIRPWYTRSEVINLALNMGIIKPDTTYYTPDKLRELCEKVRENDVRAETLLAHRELILESDAIHVVQYYTLNGAYFMNQYMRNLESSIRNPVLESCILRMWELIHSAPALDKEYIVYRFVDTDYLAHLKEGDIFIDPGFVSVTRDPFYKSDQYKFGFILMKIKIKPRKGSCLSLEPWSHFAKEQELVFPPYTKLRLINRNRNAPYFHIDKLYTEQITTRYEFEMVNVAEPKIPPITKPYVLPAFVNLLKSRVRTDDNISVQERIMIFHDKYLDPLRQFRIEIGKHKFTIMTEWFNSMISYKDFYAHMNRRGFSMYGFSETLNKDRILFFIEVVAELHELHVNYYFKWSDDSHLFSVITEDEFLLFVSKLAYMLGIQRVIIYGRYRFCHTIGGECTSGSYRADTYEYLKNGSKRFSTSDFASPQFSYVQLDSWKTTPAFDIVKVSDRDQFYQQVQLDSKITIAQLYTNTVENHCSQLGILEAKIARLYKGVNAGFNPLDQIFWVLESYEMLHQKGIIAVKPDDDPELVQIFKTVIRDEGKESSTRMNRYRLG